MTTDNPAASGHTIETLVTPRITLIVLLLTTALLYMGTGLFGTLLGVRASLEDFAPAWIGLIMSSYFVGFIIGAYVCVHIIQQVGHIRAFAAFAAVFTAMALAHAIWVEVWPWVVFRLISGIAVVGLALVIESWLNAQAPADARGRVFSVYMVVNLSAVAAGQLLLMAGDPATFVLFSVAAVLFVLSLVPTTVVRVSAPAPQPAGGLGLKALLKASPVGVIGCLVSGIVGGAFWGMAPVFITDLGYDRNQVAVFMFVAIVGGMISQFPVGRFSDSRDRRKVIAGVTILASVAAALVSVTAAISFNALIGAAFLFGALVFPIYGLTVARTHDMLRPDQVLEATRGLLQFFAIGAAIGPFAAGVLMGVLGGYALFGGMAAALAAMGAYCIYRLRKGKALAPEEQCHFVPIYATSQEALAMAEDEYYPEEEDGAPGKDERN
ncbi:MFS transporter [Alkalicaulis satelles]|nr:MFS transporter [Alkalicaulis satelles]